MIGQIHNKRQNHIFWLKTITFKKEEEELNKIDCKKVPQLNKICKMAQVL